MGLSHALVSWYYLIMYNIDILNFFHNFLLRTKSKDVAELSVETVFVDLFSFNVCQLYFFNCRCSELMFPLHEQHLQRCVVRYKLLLLMPMCADETRLASSPATYYVYLNFPQQFVPRAYKSVHLCAFCSCTLLHFSQFLSSVCKVEFSIM